MGPPIRKKSSFSARREQARHSFWSPRPKKPDQPKREGTATHDKQQNRDGAQHVTQGNLWEGPGAASDRQQDAEKSTHSPSRDYAPPEGQQSWRLRMKDRWVKDSKVFDINPCRDLVVHNTVHDSCNNASCNNLQEFHVDLQTHSGRSRLLRLLLPPPDHAPSRSIALILLRSALRLQLQRAQNPAG